jgi:hypothetical protein
LPQFELGILAGERFGFKVAAFAICKYTPHGIKLSFSVVEKSSTCSLVRHICIRATAMGEFPHRRGAFWGVYPIQHSAILHSPHLSP